MSESCGSCRFYSGAETKMCRHSPPTTIVSEYIGEPRQGGFSIRALQVQSHFPLLDAEQGWCGRFERDTSKLNS